MAVVRFYFVFPKQHKIRYWSINYFSWLWSKNCYSQTYCNSLPEYEAPPLPKVNALSPSYIQYCKFTLNLLTVFRDVPQKNCSTFWQSSFIYAFIL
jgi:hypothetical protein